MHEIPQDLNAVRALVEKSANSAHPLDTDEVIQGGLQNWIQELTDEGIEGGYLTAALEPDKLVVTDSLGRIVLSDASLAASDLVPRFKQDPHMTLLAVQTAMRKIIDAGRL